MHLVFFDFVIIALGLTWVGGLMLFLPATWAIGRNDPMMWLVTIFWLPVTVVSLGYDLVEQLWRKARR